ncbi:hypothetical protein D3C73_185930 [compost metagenome]
MFPVKWWYKKMGNITSIIEMLKNERKESEGYTDLLTLVIRLLKAYDQKEYIETEEDMQNKVMEVIHQLYA